MVCRRFVLLFLFFLFAEGAAVFAGDAGGPMEEIIILGDRAGEIENEIPSHAVKVEQVWEDADSLVTLTVKDHKKILKLKVSRADTGRQLATYTLIPWQNFTVNNEAAGVLPKDTFLTVTGCAVIYVSYSGQDLTEKEKGYVRLFDNSFRDLIDYKNCSSQLHDADLDIPEGIQTLSVRIYPFYIDLQVALPGSALPEQSRWGKVAEDRMIRVSLVPERGETRIMWFTPVRIKDLSKDLFGGYTPKITPDRLEDFMPELYETLHAMPEAEPENLNSLIGLFIEYKTGAAENPGHWEEGNMLLGARKREYIPSKEEVLLSETGNRLRRLIGSVPKERLKRELGKKYSDLRQLEYVRFTYTHVDVMGSGRFYYIDTMTKIRIFPADYVF